MAKFESVADDGIPIKVLYPGETQKHEKRVCFVDVNGVDIPVSEVKRQLLALRNISNHQDYVMVGEDINLGRERFQDDVAMAYYVEQYLTPDTSFITFVLRQS